MTLENQPFEDVSPTRNGWFSSFHPDTLVVFQPAVLIESSAQSTSNQTFGPVQNSSGCEGKVKSSMAWTQLPSWTSYSKSPKPIPSMGLAYFTYIYHTNQPNVGKIIPCMEPMVKEMVKVIKQKGCDIFFQNTLHGGRSIFNGSWHKASKIAMCFPGDTDLSW